MATGTPPGVLEQPCHSLAGSVAQAGIDPTLEGRALQNALLHAIATRGGYCWWDVGRPLGHAGWVVTLDSPERHDFYGKALAWCLVWLMAKGTPGDWGLGTGHPKGLDWGLGTGHPQGLDWGDELGIGRF